MMKNMILILLLILSVPCVAQNTKRPATDRFYSAVVGGRCADGLHVINMYAIPTQIGGNGLECRNVRAVNRLLVHGDTLLSGADYFVRQDGDELYYFEDTAQVDKSQLLMDFGLSEGDEFPSPAFGRMKVVAVRDTLVSLTNSSKYNCRRLSLRGIDDPRASDEWLEGVGSLRTGLLPPSIQKQLVEPELVQSVIEGTYWFVQNSGSDKSLQNGSMLDTGTTKSISYRTESSPCYCSKPWNCSFSDDTLLIEGRLDKKLNYLLTLYIDGHDLYGQNLECGFSSTYGLAGAHYHFSVKVPGFQAGTYRIHFDDTGIGFSTNQNDTQFQYIFPDPVYGAQYCFYIKETYLNQEVTSNGPTASVPDLIADQPTTAARGLYDLTGRRLTSEPARGIFIRDGKKVWK